MVASQYGNAVLPICTSYNTATAVYVGPRRFGMLWPRLTFARRGLVGRVTREGSDVYDQFLDLIDVEIKLWPWCWPDLQIPPQTCGASSFLCPAQVRHMRDPAVMHATYDPLSLVPQPWMPETYWRLDTRPCRGRCIEEHPYLGNLSGLQCIIRAGPSNPVPVTFPLDIA